MREILMILNIQYSIYVKIYTLAMRDLSVNLNLFQDRNDDIV